MFPKKESYPARRGPLRLWLSLVLLFTYAAALALSTPFCAFASNAKPRVDVKIKAPSPSSKGALSKIPSLPKKQLASIPEKQLEQTFKNALAKMEQTKKSPVKACWRQPWEDIRDTFLSIYQSDQSGKKFAPKALFKAGESQEALARCSRLPADFRTACSIYKSVAEEFPSSALAPEALLAATALCLDKERNLPLAQKLITQLQKKYPKSPACKKSAGLQKELARKAPVPPKEAKASIPRLESLSWDSINKNQVKITLKFSLPAQIQTSLVRQGGKGARIEVGIANASVVSEIRKGISIRGSLLKKVSVRTETKGSTRVLFDFAEVRHFNVKKERNSTKIVLTVDSLAGSPKQKGKDFVQEDEKSKKLRAAAQLLEEDPFVVAVDAGHGGKDPGTMHNGIIERNIALDIALRLGRVLKKRGSKVVYTRQRNVFVGLTSRTQKANKANADLFVSIHVNSNPYACISGFEAYYLDRAYKSDTARLASIENGRKAPLGKNISTVALHRRIKLSRSLALSIHNKTIRKLRDEGFCTTGHGVRSGPFCVLGTANMPAVLAEVGYCTNAQDAKLLASPEYRQALAEGMADGICSYQERVSGRLLADTSRR